MRSEHAPDGAAGGWCKAAIRRKASRNLNREEQAKFDAMSEDEKDKFRGFDFCTCTLFKAA